MSEVTVRFRVDLSEACAVGPGKIALVEGIARSGSLSQAARDLDMSYRRAWMLLDSLNSAFRQPVVTLSTGGKGGGGATVTPFGETLIATYRKFEAETQQRANATFAALARRARAEPTSDPAVPRRALKRHAGSAKAALVKAAATVPKSRA